MRSAVADDVSYRSNPHGYNQYTGAGAGGPAPSPNARYGDHAPDPGVGSVRDQFHVYGQPGEMAHQRDANAYAGVEDAMQAIENAHPMPNFNGLSNKTPVTIDIESTMSPGQLGMYSPAMGGHIYLSSTRPETADYQRPPRDRSSVALTTIHEMGHAMDFKSYGDNPGRKPGSSMPRNSPIGNGPMKAIKESPSVRAAKENPPRTETREPGVSKGSSMRDRARYDYLSTPTELHARAYTQYVVSKQPPGAPLKAAFERERVKTTLNDKVHPTYWSDAEFKPIGKAYDEMFGAVK